MNDFARAIQRLDVTSACMTPTVASLVDPVRVLSLKYPTLAGEVGTKDTCNADTYADRVCLRNCFGPAEPSIYYTWNGPTQAQKKPACIKKLPSSRILLVSLIILML